MAGIAFSASIVRCSAGVGHNQKNVTAATNQNASPRQQIKDIAGATDQKALPGATVVALATPSCVGKAGLEPARLAAHDPKSCSSANSDTSPPGKLYHRWRLCQLRSNRARGDRVPVILIRTRIVLHEYYRVRMVRFARKEVEEETDCAGIFSKRSLDVDHLEPGSTVASAGKPGRRAPGGSRFRGR